MSHTKATEHSVLTLEADDCGLMRWHIDVSFAVHNDMRGHTGGGLTLGKGESFNSSHKKKINEKSSAEIEIIGVDNLLPQVSWMNYFTEAEGWMMNATAHQDSESAISLENNG